MNENDPLESQLRSWMPRPPSAKIAARLFNQAGERAASRRRGLSLGWLAPVAACVLALLAVDGSARRGATLDERDAPAYFATLMLDTSASAAPQALLLSRTDLNVEWNTWPRSPWTTGAVAVARAAVSHIVPPIHLDHFTLPFTNR